MPKRNTQSTEKRILSRIYGKGRGWVFTPDQFADLGSKYLVLMGLKSICDRGTIRRISRGIYHYPKTHPQLGELHPSIDDIADALASRDRRRIQPAGAYAANLLGLTNQVPAKIVYLTDGPDRRFKVGKRTIFFKNTTPKNMATAGRLSGLVIQALKHLKKDNVDRHIIDALKSNLSQAQKRQLLDDIAAAPIWIAEIFRKLNEKE